MAVDYQEVLDAVPAIVKVIQDAVLIEQAVVKNGFIATLPAIIQYQGDFQAAFTALDAFFVNKAVASGAVVKTGV